MIEIILIISILAGELVKIPLFGNQGPVLLDAAVIFLTLFGLYNLKFKFKKPSLSFKIIYFFILVALFSLLLTPLHLSRNEYLVSFSYLLRLFLYVLFSYLIYAGAFPSFKKKISQTFLFTGVGLSILGLLQFLIIPNLGFLQAYGWDPHYLRTVSTFLDPNFAGAFFVLTLILLMDRKKMTKITIVSFVTLYLALLTTFSRSSYLMFLISGITLSFLLKSKKLLILTTILFVILLISFQFYSQLIAKPRGISREQSASYRIDTWQEGITIFEKSPLLGIGFNAYKYAIRQYNLADQQFLQSRGSSTNDSSLLYVLATTGIIGFLIYLLFLFSLIRNFKNNYLLTAGLIGLIPHSLFANSLFYPFILIWILLKAVDIKD